MTNSNFVGCSIGRSAGRPTENPVHEDRTAGEEVYELDSIRHEAAGLHKILRLIGGGDLVLRSELRKKPHVLECERTAKDDDRMHLTSGHDSKAILKVTHTIDFVPERLDLESANRRLECFSGTRTEAPQKVPQAKPV